MAFSSLYNSRRIGLSFELYPPKTEKGERALFRHVEKLNSLNPNFFTCTYGAGGSTQDKTLGVISRVKREYGLPVASHLTCVGATVDQLRSYLHAARQQGIDAIVALRGDPPQGESAFKPAPGGLSYANELVSLIRAEYPTLDVAVAAYPEVHREAPDWRTDLANLKRKVEAGADIVITQLFYDNDDFFRFRDRYHAAGIAAPLVPGILPVTTLSQVQRIATLCGSAIPEPLSSRLQQSDDADWQFQVGVEHSAGQLLQLVERGVPGMHFYVLNRSQSALAVMQAIAHLNLPR